jgi:hypothetical protein
VAARSEPFGQILEAGALDDSTGRIGTVVFRKRSDVTSGYSETCACGSSTHVKVTNGGFAAENQINAWRRDHYCSVRPAQAGTRH